MKSRHWAFDSDCPVCHDLASFDPQPVACQLHIDLAIALELSANGIHYNEAGERIA